MEEVVLGVEFLVHRMNFIDIDRCYPCVTATFDENSIFTIIPYNLEAYKGSCWQLDQVSQIFITINAFDKVKEWKMSLDLLTATDPAPLGSITYDIHALACDSLARRGSSPLARATSVFKDIVYQNPVAKIKFDMRIIYFKNVSKKPSVLPVSIENVDKPQKNKSSSSSSSREDFVEIVRNSKLTRFSTLPPQSFMMDTIF